MQQQLVHLVHSSQAGYSYRTAEDGFCPNLQGYPWDFHGQVLAVDWENVGQNVGVLVETPVWKVAASNMYYYVAYEGRKRLSMYRFIKPELNVVRDVLLLHSEHFFVHFHVFFLNHRHVIQYIYHATKLQ